MTTISSQIVELYPLIASKKLTKADVARTVGKSQAYVTMVLKRAKLLDSVRTPRASAAHDSDAMTAALEEALRPDKDGANAPAGAKPITNAEIARKHGVPYAAFSMRVLHARRSRLKADLRNDQNTTSGAAPA